jgi:hypothetical protein
VLQKVFLVTTLFGVANILITVVSWTNLGRSSPTILFSDLLFFEGSLILVIGTFIAVVRAWREPEPKTNKSTEENESDEGPHFSVLMIIIGVVLIVLAVAVGTAATSI